MLPGDVRFWMIGSVLVSTALVVWGRYHVIELVATGLAALLALTSVVAAVSVFPSLQSLAIGMVPQVPPGVDYGEIVPWLGFMLSGAAGMMWYSYWIRAKGFGAAELTRTSEDPIDPSTLGPEDRRRLAGWVTHMTLDNTTAVVGTLVITLAFLILGTEMLRPNGLVPEESRVAEVLGHMLGDVWGPVGFWFMVLGVFIGFWDTVLTDQDGFGRMFANGTLILLRPLHLKGRLADDAFWQRAYVIGLLTVVPIALYLTVGEPVGLLKAAGVIEAAHIPVLAGLVLYLNHRFLPADYVRLG
ncbi:MAG: Nramp family divalent metal transporter [Candidatus Binatia bacterium]